jgi:hypothetical protein
LPQSPSTPRAARRAMSRGLATVQPMSRHPAPCTRSTSSRSIRWCSCQSVVAPAASTGAIGSRG